MQLANLHIVQIKKYYFNILVGIPVLLVFSYQVDEIMRLQR